MSDRLDDEFVNDLSLNVGRNRAYTLDSCFNGGDTSFLEEFSSPVSFCSDEIVPPTHNKPKLGDSAESLSSAIDIFNTAGSSSDDVSSFSDSLAQYWPNDSSAVSSRDITSHVPSSSPTVSTIFVDSAASSQFKSEASEFPDSPPFLVSQKLVPTNSPSDRFNQWSGPIPEDLHVKAESDFAQNGQGNSLPQYYLSIPSAGDSQPPQLIPIQMVQLPNGSVIPMPCLRNSPLAIQPDIVQAPQQPPFPIPNSFRRVGAIGYQAPSLGLQLFDRPDCPLPNSSNALNNQPPTNGLSPPISCPECGRTYTLRKSYVAHLRRHRQRFPCVFCGKVFPARHDLKRHLTCVHGVSSAEFALYSGGGVTGSENDTGSVTSPASQQMNQPLVVSPAAAPRNFQCDKCGRPFNQKSNLRRHQSRHCHN